LQPAKPLRRTVVHKKTNVLLPTQHLHQEQYRPSLMGTDASGLLRKPDDRDRLSIEEVKQSMVKAGHGGLESRRLKDAAIRQRKAAREAARKEREQKKMQKQFEVEMKKRKKAAEKELRALQAARAMMTKYVK
jgi:hypothetical protein